jgi:hypothetical protein
MLSYRLVFALQSAGSSTRVHVSERPLAFSISSSRDREV